MTGTVDRAPAAQTETADRTPAAQTETADRAPAAQTGTVDIDPCRDQRWALLHESAGGSLFTSVPWMAAVATTYGFTPRATLVTRGDSPVAGLAYCAVDDIRGPRLVSFPFSDYADPLGDDASTRARALEPLLDGSRLRMKVREHRLPIIDERLGQSRDLLWHAIDIDPDLDETERFERLHPKVRQNVRRARRAGVEVEVGGELAMLRRFYDLHVGVRIRKYGLLPQPFAFFEQLHAAFAPTDDLAVMLATHGGRTVAGIVFIRWHDSLYYKFNASSADALGARPNELLIWHGIELAASLGLSRIDLGVSDIDQPGLVRFKRKLADREGDVVSLTGEGAEVPASDQVGAVLGQLTEILTADDVPAEIAERAGSLLYRYFA